MTPESPQPGLDSLTSGFTRIEFNNPSDQKEVDRAADFEDEEEEDEDEYDFSDGTYNPDDDPDLIASLTSEDDPDQKPSASTRLGYEPFIAAKEWAAVRRANNPAEVRRRLGEIRHQLVEQQTGLAALLQTLHNHLEVNPDTVPTDLIDATAVNLRLTDTQYNNLHDGLEAFAQDRTNAKALYEAHQGEATAIFAACFRQPPHAQVNVILTGANLHFQCFDLEDYVFAFNTHNHGGDAVRITQDQHNRAANSGGAATRVTESSVGIDGPSYSITLENLANSHRTETQTFTETTVHSLNNSEYYGSFRFNPIHHLTISSGDHSWDIAVTKQGERLHIHHEVGSEVADFDLLRQTRADGSYGGYRRSDHPDDFADHTYQEMLDFATGHGYQSELRIDEHGITYTDHRSEGGAVTATQESCRTVNVATNPLQSQLAQIHESQHRFNAYFVPLEDQLTSSSQIAALRQQEHDPDPGSTKQRLLYNEVRAFRRQSVDRYARDEVLAYFHQGSPPDQIFSTLAHSSLYDYSHQPHLLKQAEIWQEDLKATWKATFILATYDGSSDAPTTTPLALTDAEIQTAMNHVFGSEYQAQLHKWTDTLTELQAYGHDRREIVALLYQEPASHWVAFADLIEPGLRSKVQQRARNRTVSP